MNCPVCGGVQVGKVGNDQYYCWNCFVEFNTSKGKISLYEVAEDGSLVCLNDSFDIGR